MKRPILHLIPHLSGGGMERRMGYIAKITNNDFPVHVAYINKGLNFKDIDLSNVKLHKINAFNNYDFRILIRLIFLIIHLRPQIIQTWSIQMDILGGFLCSVFSINHILMEPNSPNDDNPKSFNFKVFIKEKLGKNAIVISNSNAGKIYWDSKNVRKSLLIRNGFDLQRILRSENDLTKKLDNFIKDNKFVVIASRLSESSLHKRTDLVIETFAKIIEKEKSLKLIICGGGPLINKYKDLVNSFGITSNVFFTGFVNRENLWKIFYKASLFISLSKYEGMSNSLVEAALCRTPLFLSKIKSHTEIVPIHLAKYVDEYNKNFLSDEIIRCLKNSKILTKNSKKLFEKLSCYTLENMGKEYLKIYYLIYNKVI